MRVMQLVRKEIDPHPWRLHKWESLEGLVGLFGIIRQCTKCHMVEVTNVLSEQTWRGPASMLSGEFE